MCRINCKIADGLVPSEKVAIFATADGHEEEVIVSTRHLQGKSLLTSEIGRTGNRVLVELPRESTSGHWRVWVLANQLGG